MVTFWGTGRLGLQHMNLERTQFSPYQAPTHYPVYSQQLDLKRPHARIQGELFVCAISLGPDWWGLSTCWDSLCICAPPHRHLMGPEQRLPVEAGGAAGVESVHRKHCTSLGNCACLLEQGRANCGCKEPGRSHFYLCWPCSACCCSSRMPP